ncbi:hypothetical protein KBD34_00870 [Patescibacteria group bacterium]|nr:hypothetical protein [Patescibacteria group bacterium]
MSEHNTVYRQPERPADPDQSARIVRLQDSARRHLRGVFYDAPEREEEVVADVGRLVKEGAREEEALRPGRALEDGFVQRNHLKFHQDLQRALGDSEERFTRIESALNACKMFMPEEILSEVGRNFKRLQQDLIFAEGSADSGDTPRTFMYLGSAQACLVGLAQTIHHFNGQNTDDALLVCKAYQHYKKAVADTFERISDRFVVKD